MRSKKQLYKALIKFTRHKEFIEYNILLQHPQYNKELLFIAKGEVDLLGIIAREFGLTDEAKVIYFGGKYYSQQKKPKGKFYIIFQEERNYVNQDHSETER